MRFHRCFRLRYDKSWYIVVLFCRQDWYSCEFVNSLELITFLVSSAPPVCVDTGKSFTSNESFGRSRQRLHDGPRRVFSSQIPDLVSTHLLPFSVELFEVLWFLGESFGQYLRKLMAGWLWINTSRNTGLWSGENKQVLRRILHPYGVRVG